MAKRKKGDEIEEELSIVDVDDHRHCVICGKAVPPKKEVCSPICQTEYDNAMKKKKNYTILFYISIAIFIGILFLQLFAGG